MINQTPLTISKPKTTYGGLRAKDGSISDDFTKSRAYEVGYRSGSGPGLAVMTYSKFGDEIFEFGSSGFIAPEGAVRSDYAEYRNFIDNPDPANDFVDALVPQKLKDPLIEKLIPEINPPFFNPVNDSAINPPFFNPVNDSAINPQPFIDFNPEKKDFNIPIILTLGIIGFLILKER